MKALLSIGEAAQRLGLSVDTVRELERSGELKAVRTPGGHRRFKPAGLDAYLERRAGPSRRGRLATPPAPGTPTRRATVVDAGLDWPPPDEEWAEPQPVTPYTQPSRSTAPSPHEAALEQIRQAAREVAERDRLEGLKSYGRSLVPWDAPATARSSVIETVATYVTPSRFPPFAAAWEAQHAIKAKVEAILEPFQQAAAREAATKVEAERVEQRVRALIERGKSRAHLKTISWDFEDTDEARAEVQDALEEEVEPDWSERDVDKLVDEVLDQWEEESED